MSKIDLFIYYLGFLLRKLLIFFECRRGIGLIILAELLHVKNFIFRTSTPYPSTKRNVYVETIWGRFYLIPNYFSLTIVSPAFERPDMDELIHLMKISLDHKKRVLFIDVGAFIGTYTIGVSTRLNAYDAFHTISIEPDPVNYALLQRNLRLNKIKRNTSFNVGLAAKNSVIREKSLYDTYTSIKDKPRYRFTFKRLDDLLTTKEVQTFDEVYIKIDIEGHEQEALEGAKKIMKSSKKVILMVEDCIDVSIISYLKKRMIFLYRRSPYNSFWSSK